MMSSTELAFTGYVSIEPPEWVPLGQVLVSSYERIRVLAECRFSEVGTIEVFISHVEGEGIPGRLDQFVLVPGSNVNEVYEVPGVVLSIGARAIGAASGVTVHVWGFRTGRGGTPAVRALPLPPPTPAVNPLDQFLPADALALTGVSTTAFNPIDADMVFTLDTAFFGVTNAADTAVLVNGVPVQPATLSLGASQLIVTDALQHGRNAINLSSVDDVGRPLSFNSIVWAGSADLQVSIVNPDGTPCLDEVAVQCTLVDDQSVQAQSSTKTGSVEFSSVPSGTLIIRVTASDNRVGIAGGASTDGAVSVTLLGFNAPSSMDNNDLSQGTAGWEIGAAPVKIIQHEDNPGPAVPSFLTTWRVMAVGPAAPDRALAHRESVRRSEGRDRSLDRLTDPTEEFGQTEGIFGAVVPATASIVDNDLELGTHGKGAQFLSRTFTTDPDVCAVRLRYRFVTAEVPGGYFGSQYNDYFSVSLRSETEGGNIYEVNSMNGLGLSAFDGAGATAWRDLTLRLDVDGDVIQADIGVANVADDRLDSRVIVDFIEEIRVRVLPNLAGDNQQGGLILEYTVEGYEVPDDIDINVFFASAPNYASRLGASVFTYRVTQGTAVGQHGPVHIPGANLRNDPAGATHLVAASTPPNFGAVPDVQVGYGPNANAAVVSLAMLNVVKDGLRAAGQANAIINSTARTPFDQARAMFNNLTNPANPVAVNVANQLVIYAPAGDAVINAFVANTQGMTPQQIQQDAANIRAAMEQEINNQGPLNVSRHCGNPAQVSVVDISSGSFNAVNGPLFMAAVAPPAHLIDERATNGCFHLEL